jgi:antitoxin component HigA of HigAB toxin-antitoxin module
MQTISIQELQANIILFTRTLKNKEDYDQACQRIFQLMDACKGTPEADELDILLELVDNYESNTIMIETATAKCLNSINP